MPYLCADAAVAWQLLENDVANPLLAPVIAWLGRLRHPTLFAIAATLFALDLVIPDVVPFVDEIMFALVTLLFGSWKNRRKPGSETAEPRTP